MTPEQLIECIKAQAEGKKIEIRDRDGGPWGRKTSTLGQWDTISFDYRIAREPRKCWVRWSNHGEPMAVKHSGSPTENFPDWQLVVEDIK